MGDAFGKRMIMRILTQKEAKKINVDFIYRHGAVLAVTEKNFNQCFKVVPRGNKMGSTQVFAEIIDGKFICPSCKHVQRKLGICGGCGHALIRRKTNR